MPAYERPITVEHLLHHTSGLRDYCDLLDLAGFREDADSPTVEEAFEIIRRQKKLNHPPGDDFEYTNSGFFLLGQIVERVSGRSLNAFAQERIFGPLGMTKTLFLDDHTRIVKDRATGYAAGENGLQVCMSNWEQTGDGSVCTTVGDLYLWDQAFSTNALGKDVMDMLQTPGLLNSGKKIDYAWGLYVTEYKGLGIVRHSGSWAGFRSAMVRFPEQRFSVIILANLDAIDPSGLALKVADIYFEGLLKEPAKPEPKKAAAAPAFVVPKADLEALAGNWQDKGFGLWVEVTVKDGKLVAALGQRSFPLTPVAPGKFVGADDPARITFEVTAAEKGKPVRARLAIGTSQEFSFEKAAPVKALGAAELGEYAGTYVSEELLDAHYTVSVNQGQLSVKMRASKPAPLKAMAPNRFLLVGYGLNVEFARGANGDVDGFTISAGRAAGIAFTRSGH
jgi:hypothetical protein